LKLFANNANDCNFFLEIFKFSFYFSNNGFYERYFIPDNLWDFLNIQKTSEILKR